MFKVCVCFFFLFFSGDICNELVVYCVGLAYDVSLSQMIDNKVDSHLKGLINHYYYLWGVRLQLGYSILLILTFVYIAIF